MAIIPGRPHFTPSSPINGLGRGGKKLDLLLSLDECRGSVTKLLADLDHI